MSAQNARGNTPLHNAARWGYLDIVKLLVSSDSRVDAVNKAGKTAEQVGLACHRCGQSCVWQEARRPEIIRVLAAERCGVKDVEAYPGANTLHFAFCPRPLTARCRPGIGRRRGRPCVSKHNVLICTLAYVIVCLFTAPRRRGWRTRATCPTQSPHGRRTSPSAK